MGNISLRKKGKQTHMIYLQLFLAFCRIGGLTFGGGYSMMPMLQKEVVERFKWATQEEIMDYYALGQCTPGIIAVNTATFVGYKVKGVLGGICASLGVIAPSIIIITVIAMFIEGFIDIPWVSQAFTAIRIAVCALITSSVVALYKKGVIDIPTFIIFAIVAILSIFFTQISPIYIVVGAAVAGVLIKKVAGGNK